MENQDKDLSWSNSVKKVISWWFELLNAWQIKEIIKGADKIGGYYSLNYIKWPGTCW